MNAEIVRDACLSLPYVTEDFPFDESTLVFRVGGKIFCLLDVEEGKSANLKCDPERAIELRETFSGVRPGYHMNKKHWNTLLFGEDIPEEIWKENIHHSYELVFKSLTKKLQHELQNR